MSSKPENNFIAAVHRKFDEARKPYFEKMHNPYRGGTWDVWYSGLKHGRKASRDLWIEYKFIPKIPTRETTLILPELSQLQLLWGAERYNEGRNVWVIVGTPEGGVVYTDTAWEEALPPSVFRSMLRSKAELADMIAAFTMP